MKVVPAPAKLTLSLRITGVRSDGYHTIDAEMITVDLADMLRFSAGDGLEVVADGGGMAVPGDDTNLVRRALSMVERTAQVRLNKRIPAGGGLGGGSADAAAVLRWAGVTDLSMAARLGADVAFCLVGGRARVSGIGEVVEPLDFAGVAGTVYTLVTPPFGVSTAEAYQAWDRHRGSLSVGRPAGTGVAAGAVAPGGDPRGTEAPGNDLEEAALVVEPRLARWRDELSEATGRRARLAGSGSTWFVEGAFPGPGRVVTRACRLY